MPTCKFALKIHSNIQYLECGFTHLFFLFISLPTYSWIDKITLSCPLQKRNERSLVLRSIKWPHLETLYTVTVDPTHHQWGAFQNDYHCKPTGCDSKSLSVCDVDTASHLWCLVINEQLSHYNVQIRSVYTGLSMHFNWRAQRSQCQWTASASNSCLSTQLVPFIITCTLHDIFF